MRENPRSSTPLKSASQKRTEIFKSKNLTGPEKAVIERFKKGDTLHLLGWLYGDTADSAFRKAFLPLLLIVPNALMGLVGGM